MGSGTSETRLGAPASRPMSLAGLTPGTILADRYRIVALLGRGGMGEVYRADDLRLGQPVALKFLPQDLEDNPFARDRLLAEVRSARTVSHPNVCRVYDVGEVHGHVFLTMEYIDGEDLASLLRRIGRLPPGKALEVARQLCAGLAAAHDRGVLHRDLKPANVMINGRGQARITDFGLALEVETAAAGAPQPGRDSFAEVAGTVAYMAPERFEGRQATVQSDLYALGMVLYEVYTGKPAVSATTIEGWRRAHRDSTPSHPSAVVSEIEPAVERAILRCLEKDPAKRPGSAAQLAASLPGGDPLAAAIAAGETPSPELVAASGEEGTLPRARAWLWLAVSLLVLVFAVPLGSLDQLANLEPLAEPAVQKTAARRILESLGYPDRPMDSAWWFAPDGTFLSALLRTAPPSEWFSRPTTNAAGTVRFEYRHTSGLLLSPYSTGQVTDTIPPPLYPEEAYLELDGRGRLLTLRMGGFLRVAVPPAPARATDWTTVFAAAGLDASAFQESMVERRAVVTADESRAWQGRVDGRGVRVEASAYRGRATEWMIVPSGRLLPRPTFQRRHWTRVLLDTFGAISIWASLLVIAVLARRNLKLARGDRRGAYRLAMVVLVGQALYAASERHWSPDPLEGLTALAMMGWPVFLAMQTWLLYVGLEPYVRRRWPGFLIAWTRLLDGRWRDPLVGRALLLGATAALVVGTLTGILWGITRGLSLPLSVPRYAHGSLDGGFAWFLAGEPFGLMGIVNALYCIAILLVSRLVFRRDLPAYAAWLLSGATLTGWQLLYGQPWTMAAPWGPLIIGAVVAGASVVLMLKEGLLAVAVLLTVVTALQKTPLTYDPTRWYAWRTGVVVVLIGALLFWGFRNVLGRQTAFPAGAFEE